MTVAALPLYRLATEYEAIVQELFEAGGEVTPDLYERMNAIEEAGDEKVARCAQMARNVMAAVEARRAEAKRLTNEAATGQRVAEWLKAYAKSYLESVGKTKVETPLGGARIQKNSQPSVTYAGDPARLPEAFVVRTLTFSASRALEALKAGEPIPEGVAVETGTHLRWL